MLLNTLYGTFGRRQDATEVIIIDNKDEDMYYLTLLSSIPLTENKTALIVQNNVQRNTLSKFNITYKTNFQPFNTPVNSNIAIASAVTRIHMMVFKLNVATCYTDTDSLFVTDLTPFKDFLSKALGYFKDELDGLVIEEAEFVGIKQYSP